MAETFGGQSVIEREEAQGAFAAQLGVPGSIPTLFAAMERLTMAIDRNTAELKADIASREKLNASLDENTAASQDLTRTVNFWIKLDEQAGRSPLED